MARGGKIVGVAALVGLLATVFTAASGGPAGAGGGQRYVDAVFEVETTSAVQYGYNEALPQSTVGPELMLDLFEPAGDPEQHRPVVIVAHGGGFCGGSRTANHIVQQARHLAARGWVTASIDYRYDPGVCNDVASITAAVRDAAAAVRWFRANAEDLRIDPTRIAALGYSAGAFIAAGLAYGNTNTSSGNAGWPSDVAAAVSEAGASLSMPPNLDAPPVQLSHGDVDGTVPFAWAQNTCDHLRATNNVCELLVHEGVGHGLPFPTVVEDARSFLRRCMAAHAGFPDVAVDDPTDLEAAVGWMAEFGITTGYGDGRFHPENGLNRHQLATFLWRMAGEPEPDAAAPFPDVDESAPYADAVAWFAQTGITQGYADGTFGPGRPVTRHQVATFLWRAVGEPEPPAGGAFPDVTADLPYADHVAWLASTGITQGYGDGTFRPANRVNRLQASQFLWRLGRIDAPWDGEMPRPAMGCANADLTR